VGTKTEYGGSQLNIEEPACTVEQLQRCTADQSASQTGGNGRVEGIAVRCLGRQFRQTTMKPVTYLRWRWDPCRRNCRRGVGLAHSFDNVTILWGHERFPGPWSPAGRRPSRTSTFDRGTAHHVKSLSSIRLCIQDTSRPRYNNTSWIDWHSYIDPATTSSFRLTFRANDLISSIVGLCAISAYPLTSDS
jgi:hypothetical protein